MVEMKLFPGVLDTGPELQPKLRKTLPEPRLRSCADEGAPRSASGHVGGGVDAFSAPRHREWIRIRSN